MFGSRDRMRVPEPRRKRGKFMRAMLWLSLLLLIAAGAAFYGKQQYEAEGPLATEQVFTVERGMNARAVAKMLAAQGITELVGRPETAAALCQGTAQHRLAGTELPLHQQGVAK